MQTFHSSRPQRVIVVDDNAGAALMLSKLVQMVGDFEVGIAHDGPSAVAQVRKMKPDLVFLDIGLPGMNGYQVAQEIRSDPSCHCIFLVALTGYGDEKDRRKSQEAGMDEHLVKPPSISQIQGIFSHPKFTAKNSSDVLGRRLPTRETSTMKNQSPVASNPVPNQGGLNVSKLKHDLGNTAHVLKMAIQVLSTSNPAPETLQHVVEGLTHEVESLKELIDSLQELQNSEASQEDHSNDLAVEKTE